MSLTLLIGTMTDLIELKQCHLHSALKDHALMVIVGYVVIIAIYCVLVRDESKNKHTKEE